MFFYAASGVMRLCRACAVLGVLCSTLWSTAEADVIGRTWTQRFDGTDYPLFTQSTQTDSHDHAESVAVDGDGNVVVAARSNGFHVSKYSAADGRLLWEQRVGTNAYFVTDSALAVAVDQRGDVVATGVVNNDYYTAKFAAADGRLLWERRYGGIGNDRDAPRALAVDHAGDVIVTGISVVHGRATSYVCGPFGGICHVPAPTDIYTAKYDGSDGRLIWEQIYDGAEENDAPAAVAVDSAGDVVVTGYTTVKRPNGSLDTDVYTVKYAAATGRILWGKLLDGGTDDWPHALVLDSAGDVILAARLSTTTSVAKLDGHSGEAVWTRSGFSADPVWVGAMTLDRNGSFAISGARSEWGDRDGSASYHPLGDKLYTAKFRSSDGELLWEQKYTRPGTEAGWLGAGAVQFAANGNVVIGGAVAVNQNPYSWRLYAAEYAAADGRIVWEKVFSAIGPQLEEVFGGMVLDANDGPVMVGSLYPRAPGAGDDVDIFIMKLGPVGQLLNISSRVEVGSAENTPIAGLIVVDPARTKKRVLIRGLGPSLHGAGVTRGLRNPAIELRMADGTVVLNDDWKQSQEAEIAGTGVAPLDDLEAAIVTSLPPGAHTVSLRGAGGEGGTGLIEVYDLDPAGAASLANISTRGQVQPGDGVMIGGFIVGTSQSGRVLIRAIGPTLPVSSALADPMLAVYDRNGTAFINDDWRSTQEAEIRATGIPPRNDRESAVLAMFPPGPYTAIVRGKTEATGVALIEIYNLQ
ncbi:hypothetical protein BH20VER1_BH20VER1_28420 [soil metagenome]